MQIENRMIATVVLAIQLQTASADAYYTGNPNSAYPPGCISGPLRDLDLSGDNVAMFFSDRIWLEVTHRIETVDPRANLGEVQLDMYRVGCAEPNRSVIVAEFRLTPEWVDPRNAQLVLPWLGGNTGFDPYPFEFRPEPNSWGRRPGQQAFTKTGFGDYTGGWDDPRRFSWRYVLEVPPSGGAGDRDDPAKYYNGRFTLQFYRSTGTEFLDVVVPPTRALLQPVASMPLGGRLSGHWVEEGAADQGLLISFSSVPPSPGDGESPEDAELVVFLSWFTFDSDGDPLWLTGAARFSQGATEASIPIEQVEKGTFLGGASAQRATVGTALLSAISCNRLELEYELDDLGLGGGVMSLQRLFSLETADYPCRDYEALQNSAYGPESN